MNSSGQDTRADRLGERFTRELASRFSRRSFLGTMGAGGIGLTLAGPRRAGLGTDVAGAHTSNPCQHSSSISCEMLTGSNSCPGGTCGCGYWTTCNSAECQYKVWSDCCDANCDNDRACISGWPRCILHKAWSGGCGTIGVSHVRCRRWYCGSGPCTC